MRAYLKSFFTEFDYPAEAGKALTAAYDAIYAHEEAKSTLHSYIDEYTNTDTLDWEGALSEAESMSLAVGQDKNTVQLLFFICMTKHAKELYDKRGLPYQIYKDSFSDLKYKLMECYKMHNVWGSFVNWFVRFFDLTRFALGRLQFETEQYNQKKDYITNEKCVRTGDTVINVHIPSSGPLTRDAVMDSFARAHEFYKDLFPDGITPFVCYSWLLNPEHKKFLPEHSNILKFMECFDITNSHEDLEFEDAWRIFYKDYKDNIDEMPTDTSLQRAYVDWIKKGGKPRMGFGVMLYKDEK